jgi:uncharacterized protein YjbI with pentapeptide repeats
MAATRERMFSNIRLMGLMLFITTVLAGLTLWILPALLTRQPSRGMTASERLKAVNDVRPPLVAFLIAVGTAGTLWFTSRTYVLSREGHVTDRYTKAVGQLGDETPAVRIGGVYALERIGNDSPKDRTTIIYVLGAFIRERSKILRERQDEPSEDVKAGLRVVGRLLVGSDATLDLRGADLRNADLTSLPQSQVLLDGAKIQGAILPEAAS